jgi:APA family basic amino acid/polyamine antiporter
VTPDRNTPEGFRKELSFWDATMLVAGSMIGSGIFIVSADMARLCGSSGWLLVMWLLSGFITLLAALSYGELAGMMPKAGGQFVYIERAWGKLIAFLYGWTVFTVIQTGVIAAVAVAFAKYTGVFVPFISNDNILFSLGIFKISSAQLLAIFCIFLLTAINSKGVKNGKLIQTTFTSAKLFALLLLIVAGINVSSDYNFFNINFSSLFKAEAAIVNNGTAHWDTLTLNGLILAIGTGMIGALFSSDAWNNVTFIAGEIKEPEKNIPRSLITGTAIVTILYLLANVAYLGLLPLQGSPDALTVVGKGIAFAEYDRVGTAAASMIFGEKAVILMAALIMISTFGCNNGIILSGARVYYAMAKEGLFFRAAGTLNTFEVPGKALWIQAAWSGVLCISGSYGDLLDYVTFASLLFYIVTIAGLIQLRKKEPFTYRPYKVKFYPFIPLIYIFLASIICIILLYTKPVNTWSGLFIVSLGIPVYFIFFRSKTIEKN